MSLDDAVARVDHAGAHETHAEARDAAVGCATRCAQMRATTADAEARALTGIAARVALRIQRSVTRRAAIVSRHARGAPRRSRAPGSRTAARRTRRRAARDRTPAPRAP